MSKLSREQISKLHEALVGVGIDQEALLVGLPPHLVASLSRSNAPAAQLLRRLHELNDAEELADGTHPLRTALLNAKDLVNSRPATLSVVREALQALGWSSGEPRATNTSVPPPTGAASGAKRWSTEAKAAIIAAITTGVLALVGIVITPWLARGSCVPNETRECPCVDGTKSCFQKCLLGGDGFSPCERFEAGNAKGSATSSPSPAPHPPASSTAVSEPTGNTKAIHAPSNTTTVPSSTTSPDPTTIQPPPPVMSSTRPTAVPIGMLSPPECRKRCEARCTEEKLKPTRTPESVGYYCSEHAKGWLECVGGGCNGVR